MSRPRTSAWYRARAEELAGILNDALLSVLRVAEDTSGGENLVEKIMRLHAKMRVRRFLGGSPAPQPTPDSIQTGLDFVVKRIEAGFIDHETVRFSRDSSGHIVVDYRTEDCPFLDYCRASQTAKRGRFCLQRAWVEEWFSQATGLQMTSAVLSAAEGGRCKCELFPASEVTKAASQSAPGTAHKPAEEEPAGEAWTRFEAQYRLVVETIADAIVVIDNEGKVMYLNPRACGVFGVPSQQAIGKPFQAGGPLGRIGDLCVRAAEELGKWEGMTTIENRDGERIHNIYMTRFSPIFSRERSRTGTMIVLEDVTREELLRRKLTAQAENLERTVREKTRELQEANAKLEILARTDSLTGLANRRTFEEILRNELLRSGRYKHCTGVLMVDVDSFKQVNDTLGHQTGDLVLKYVASILTKSVRASDTVARWGGDEFILLLPQAGPAECKAVARRISENLLIENASEMAVPGVCVTLSVGWATCVGGDADNLVARADKMMYKNKAAGKARVTRDGNGSH